MIAALLLLADAPPRLAVPAAVFADAQVALPSARLVWPAGTRLRVEAGEGELVVRADRPLPADAIDAFRDAAGEAIGDLRWNDDSLVLRAAPGRDMRWRQSGVTVTVAFAPPPVVAAPVTAGVDEAAIAGIEADAAAGYPGRARRGALALRRRYPDDRRVARLVADTQAADGDVRGAARGYRALDARDRSARRAIAAAPGTASLGVVARDGSDMAQAEFGARIDAAVDDRIAVGGGLRHIASKVVGARSAGASVVDASVTARLAETVRVQLLASAALDDAVTGGGARLVAGSADAQFRATLTAHMPDYSTPAQVLAGGYLSRALIGVTYRLTPGVVVQADGGVQRYGLAGDGGASDTIVASAGADYLIRRQFPALGLTYRYEAEYVQRMLRRADGVPVIPLASRENHTLQGFASLPTGAVQWTALAGWTVDRLGGDGPTASLGLAAPIGIGWRVEASGGITSIARAGFSGRQLFARAALTRSLGDAP
ncbi:hypothetical protein M9979_03530 [Sphingomonas sp. RP10(2022)]|uniref:Autotransporter domain-containing protein n=1 Tax=Sphingomonas liriopis TaxID=2949094 RepID=A0A9X2KPI1_9SPHN|nr:hypothetical protein [Sphingomonas liriopis]MCP3733945.1 hypothetical protein [Sphingomonas liriopis]